MRVQGSCSGRHCRGGVVGPRIVMLQETLSMRCKIDGWGTKQCPQSAPQLPENTVYPKLQLGCKRQKSPK